MDAEIDITPGSSADDSEGSSGAPDLRKLGDMLRELSDRISAIQSMLPQDDGEERSETIDEANSEADQAADEDGPGAQTAGAGSKDDAKAAAAAMIARQLK